MKTAFCLATAIVVLAVLTPLAHAVDPTAWNTKINGPGRFTVLTQFNKEAVFDKETGLVWERSPSTLTSDQIVWALAQSHCNTLTVGDRKGWRLPTIQEMASLVDPSVLSPGPTLPAGNPFIGVHGLSYWSATTDTSYPSAAWMVNFYDGGVAGGFGKSSTFFVWCVRGGQGVDPQ